MGITRARVCGSGLEQKRSVKEAFRFSFLRKFVLWFFGFSVSLSWMAANVEAQGSVEISSPEESIESSLSGLSLPPSSIPTMLPALGSALRDQNIEVRAGVPVLPAGSFAYQIDPLSAFLSAAVVMGVQSLREEGKVNASAIADLLNNTDFYAGVLGSLQAAIAQKGIKVGANKLASRLAPRTVDMIAKNKALGFLGNIVGGITYTISVGAGYEYFSQFWKLSCQGVDGVNKVSDFVRAPWESKFAVLNNLYKYFLMGDIQKRIVSSVFNHRIFTFEFISMNIAMYIGVVTGAMIAERIGPAMIPGAKKTIAKVLTEYFAKVVGGILFGVVVQFIPDAFRLTVNRKLMHLKLDWAKASLHSTLEDMESALRVRRYPPRPNRSTMSFWDTAQSLPADIDRVFRARDLVMSLEAQRMMILKEPESAAESMKETQELIDEKFQLFHRMSGGRNPLRDPAETDQKFVGDEAEDDLGLSLQRDLFQDEYQRYYSDVLEMAQLKFDQTWKSFHDFFALGNHLKSVQ